MSSPGDRIGKEWSQWTQRLASPCRQKAKFLNLIPHLWCSDCLLPLFQTYIAWRSPCLLGAVSSKLLRCCLPGSESSTFPLNEITLCFQVVTIFWSTKIYKGLAHITSVFGILTAEWGVLLLALLLPYRWGDLKLNWLTWSNSANQGSSFINLDLCPCKKVARLIVSILQM